MPRELMLKVRVSSEEKVRMEDKALAYGCSLSDLVRMRVLECRLRQTPEEKERLRLLARVGNNLNQLARWANIHKEKLASVEILLQLDSLWTVLLQSQQPNSVSEEGPCT